MKKKGKCSKVVLSLLIASFVVPGQGTIPALANERTLDTVLKDQTVSLEEKLKALTNPVLQHYSVDQSQKVWQMVPSTRFVILANQENIENDRLSEVVQLINSEFMEKEIVTNKTTPLAMTYASKEEVQKNDIFINIDRQNAISDKTTSDEAYKIEIGENGVYLTGASENAVLYGLRTIQNLMITNNGLVYGTIVDYPDMKERRVHVDCARKYISKDWFIREIREMSYMKMNALQMHFSENLGFRIECETDPEIVSKDGYLTKQEVREIIAEAKKYGIKIIPSFDSPGHVDQILKAHPEFGQISNDGTHYKSGLDVTNPEAIKYIRSLYSEYMDLFEGCTDFHIGGDEYMEFDRAPFTTKYQSVLNNYAVEKYGQGYTWKDVIAGYINDLAEFVHERGFTPRIWNDGIYYGENSDYGTPQKIKMHDYIGIDFWSQMGWNPDIAKLKTFVDKGHDTIYNFNASFFYYVLRNDKPTDGREQHSFDNLNADKKIFEEFTPGKFQANTAPDDASYIKGASMGIWCDNPNLVDEDVIIEDISDELRALASKSWNTKSNANLTFEQFKENYEKLGNVAGFEKGSKLPSSGEIIPSIDLGKVTLKYVTTTGETIKNDVVKYGKEGQSYEFSAEEIYGYQLVSDEVVKGTYHKEGDTYTFVYELYCNKTNLKNEVENSLIESHYIKETIPEYSKHLENATAVLENETSTQLEVDRAYESLVKVKEKAVHLDFYPLYVEATYPLSNDGYVSGYSEYEMAIQEGLVLLKDKNLTVETMKAAFNKIVEAKNKLVKPSGNTPTVEATDDYYSVGQNPKDKYSYAKMLDNNPNTKTWFNNNQEKDKTINFTFPNIVKMSQIKIDQPQDCGADIIKGANVEISVDGQNWTKVGDLNNVLSKIFTFEATKVKYVRICLTEDKNNWYQIQDVNFTFEEIEQENTLKDLITEVENLQYLDKDIDYVSKLVDQLIIAQKAYVNNETDTKEIENALQTAKDQLNNSLKLDFTDLNNLINDAQKIDLSKYVDTKNFEVALNKAKEMVKMARSQSEINTAKSNLQQAIDQLVEKDNTEQVTVDKKALKDKLNEASQFDSKDYTKASYQALQTAISKANLVLNDKLATQQQVDDAIVMLQTAIDDLVKVTPTPTPTPPTSDDKGDGTDSKDEVVDQTTQSNPKQEVVKTGDTTHTIYGAMLVVSVIGLVFTKKRKVKNN